MVTVTRPKEEEKKERYQNIVLCIPKIFEHILNIKIIFRDNTQKSDMFIFGASLGIPLEMRFERGHNHGYKTHTVSELRRFAKVIIQMKKTKIRD